MDTMDREHWLGQARHSRPGHGSPWPLVAMAVMLGLIAWLALASATYTSTAPEPAGSRPERTTNRYATPVAGLMWIDATITDVDDGDTALDSQLCGYLERLVFTADGNDTSWSLSVLDAQGKALFEKTDVNSLGDPYGYAVSEADEAGTVYGGVPFAGGLTIRVADANDGDDTEIAVRLYITEAWRR